MSNTSVAAAPSLQIGDQRQKHKQQKIYTYESNLPVFSIDWSQRKDQQFRLAFSSFKEKTPNKITVVQLDENANELKQIASVEHNFPPTKVMWMPYSETDKADLFASTGDALRIWEMKDGTAVNRCTLNSV